MTRTSCFPHRNKTGGGNPGRSCRRLPHKQGALFPRPRRGGSLPLTACLTLPGPAPEDLTRFSRDLTDRKATWRHRRPRGSDTPPSPRFQPAGPRRTKAAAPEAAGGLTAPSNRYRNGGTRRPPPAGPTPASPAPRPLPPPALGWQRRGERPGAAAAEAAMLSSCGLW